MSIPMVALASNAGYRPVTQADLPIGGTRCLDVEGTGILVARGQDGAYYAVQQNCSHIGLPLDGGRVRGNSIVCPHHGARFDLKSGRMLGPPAYTGIAAFPTRERDGQVEVWVYS